MNSLEDFNKMLEWCGKQSDIIEVSVPKLDFYCNTRIWSFIEDCQRYIKLTTRYIKDIVDDDGNTTYQFLTDDDPKYVCTWLFDKTGEDKENFDILTDPIPDYDGLKYMLDKVQYKKTKIIDYCQVKERE